MITQLASIFSRDLDRLAAEITAYKQEQNLWQTVPGISNAAGNLCLHLIGNLNHFIGAEFGKTGYVRDRPKEFSDTDVPRELLLADIEKTKAVVQHSLSTIGDEDLKRMLPFMKGESEVSAEFLLLHLSTHLSYHLGQINYHRRIIDEG
jgi:uncharacterized damage-inducible protein DinB